MAKRGWLCRVFHLYRYFLKGAKVDAAILGIVRSRINMGRVLKPGVIPKNDDGLEYYEESDSDIHWKIESKGRLLLKNNSLQHAYDIQIPNAKDCFNEVSLPAKLTSLEPNQSIEISFVFTQFTIKHTGPEADDLPSIPACRERFPLKIIYKNEGNYKFHTTFYISENNPENIYWM